MLTTAALVSAPGAATAAPSDNGAPDAAFVAAAVGQQPLIQAASYLTSAAEGPNGAGFGGVALGDGVVDLYWKKALPGWMADVMRRAETIAPVTVHVARYSLAERDDAAAAVVKASAANPQVRIHSVSVPVGSDDLLVETDGDVEVAKQHARKLSAVPVRSAKKNRPRFTHRRNDGAPFSGGNRISNGAGECTSGWSVSNGARRVTNGPTIAMLTAGHCGWPTQRWVTPQDGAFIGSSGTENVGHDIMTINTGWAANRMYDGGSATSPTTQYFKSVVGWDRTFPGEMLCTSGSTTGASCDLRNSNNFSYSYVSGTETYNDLVLATRLNNGVGSLGGDSGGPVFALAGDSPRIENIGQGLAQQGQVIAKGTISGRRGTSDVMYQDFHTSYGDFSVVPVTALNIIGLRSRRCIDADLNTINANPNRAQLWDCNNQSQQQMAWNTYDDHTIRNARNGKCLDADLNRINVNGAAVQWWDCNAQNQQRWFWTAAGEIRSDYNGKCLDADLNTIGGNGTRLQLWDCNGQSQQKWLR
jgi:hypothetical protein